MLTTPSRKMLSAILALGTITIAMALQGRAADAIQSHPPAARSTWVESRASQLVFFAVLEGLYRDGVTNADVDVIIPAGTHGRSTFNIDNFVYACPLCHPAFEAFRLYRQREKFYGFKGRVDTLETGLNDATRQHLHSTDATERHKAIEDMISRWVGERLNMMRLTADERTLITQEMEKGRKQGMGGLKQASASSSQSRTNCPICDGSFGACKLRAQ